MDKLIRLERSARNRQPAKSAGDLPSADTGILVGFTEAGQPLVDYPGNPTGGAIEAHTTVELDQSRIGSEVVLVFRGGDPRSPIILGCLIEPSRPSAIPPTVVYREGRLTLTAEREIVMECGDAAVVLTKAGKAIIRGRHVVSRSSGANRIKGASVEIN